MPRHDLAPRSWSMATTFDCKHLFDGCLFRGHGLDTVSLRCCFLVYSAWKQRSKIKKKNVQTIKRSKDQKTGNGPSSPNKKKEDCRTRASKGFSHPSVSVKASIAIHLECVWPSIPSIGVHFTRAFSCSLSEFSFFQCSSVLAVFYRQFYTRRCLNLFFLVSFFSFSFLVSVPPSLHPSIP